MNKNENWKDTLVPMCRNKICDNSEKIESMHTFEGKTRAILLWICRKLGGCKAEKLCQAGISKVTSDLELTPRETFFSICF